MKVFRRLSTARLVGLLAAVVAVAAAASAGSMAAFGSSAETPQPKPLDQAIEDALTAPAPEGVTARVTFTNNLVPSTALTGVPGAQGSALFGASGRLWWSPDTGGRIELQSDAGDSQILWDRSTLTVWDSSTNTVDTLPLPAQSADSSSTEQAPTLADIDTFLQHLADHADAGSATPASIAGEPAYTVSVTPKAPSGLVGPLDLAWDAANGVPLEIALHAKGSTAPALALTVDDISFGPVAASDLAITPPADAKQVDLGGQTQQDSSSSSTPAVTGLDAVQAAVPFTIVAPDTLAGLQRGEVRLLDGKNPGALVLYGEGLGTVALVEHAADAGSGGAAPASLPKVNLGQESGQELATALGTALFFDHAGVSFVLAGSIPASDAESAAQSITG
jgi:hypothetical protein